MKDLRNYILVGIITAIIIYLVSPYMFGNRVVILETSNQQLSSEKNLSYSNIFQKVNKSVVSIYTRKSATRNNIFFIDPRERALKKKEYNRIGQGSGVIVSRQGHIITNFHVIAGSEEILIQDYKGNEYGTSVIGIDPLTDLAVLKIDETTKPIQFGKINLVDVGDIALAIGNPKGIGQTLTLGIISATDKEVMPDSYSYQRYIQTDAAINPGNSGGALVNMNGDLIGINTMIITSSGGSDGIGFAIPIDIVKYVFTEIIEHSEVIRGFVGISAEKNYKGLGVLIKAVLPNGPGDLGGVKPYDIIKKINGVSVQEIKDVQKIIGMLKPGQVISMDIQRENKSLSVNISVTKMDYQQN